MFGIAMTLLIMLTTLFTNSSNINKTSQIQIPKHIVCLDAGHGEDDSGATNGDLIEADISLDITNRLKNLLEQNNYQVVLTRPDSNTLLTNSQRAQVCNQNHAEILLSIHLNYNPDQTLDYTQGLYGSEEKDKKFSDFMTQTLASSLNLPNGETTDFESNLMLKAQMPASLQETVFLSSPDEYSLLSSGEDLRQQQIAQALYTGINNWFLQTN